MPKQLRLYLDHTASLGCNDGLFFTGGASEAIHVRRIVAERAGR